MSGFGQHRMREGEPLEREQCLRIALTHMKLQFTALLWSAPEILRILPTNLALLDKEDMKMADIYTVGTLLYEIYGRQGPYGDDLIDTSRDFNTKFRF